MRASEAPCGRPSHWYRTPETEVHPAVVTVAMRGHSKHYLVAFRQDPREVPLQDLWGQLIQRRNSMQASAKSPAGFIQQLRATAPTARRRGEKGKIQVRQTRESVYCTSTSVTTGVRDDGAAGRRGIFSGLKGVLHAGS